MRSAWLLGVVLVTISPAADHPGEDGGPSDPAESRARCSDGRDFHPGTTFGHPGIDPALTPDTDGRWPSGATGGRWVTGASCGRSLSGELAGIRETSPGPDRPEAHR